MTLDLKTVESDFVWLKCVSTVRASGKLEGDRQIKSFNQIETLQWRGWELISSNYRSLFVVL